MKNLIKAVLFLILVSCSFQHDDKSPHRVQHVITTELLPGAIIQFHHAMLGLKILNSSAIIGTTETSNCSICSYPFEIWSLFYSASGSLIALKTIRDQSKRQNNKFIELISNILYAQSWIELTLVYGDIPYKTALLGHKTEDVFYNTQQLILEENIMTLENAIEQLNTVEAQLLVEDLYYQGDPNSWIKYANGLLARYYLVMMPKDTAYLNKAFDVVNKSFTSNEDNNVITNENNPQFEFGMQRPSTYVIKQVFLDHMIARNDPRADTYPLNDHWAPYITDSFWGMIDSPISTLTYTEIKFLEAEIHLRKGKESVAELMMQGGVISNFEWMGFTPVAYQDYMTQLSFDGLSTFDEKLDKLLTEKYYSLPLAGSSELWNDFRRTGYPSMIDSLGWRVPPMDVLVTRYAYPDVEFETNEENVMKAISQQGSGTGDWDDVLWVFDN